MLKVELIFIAADRTLFQRRLELPSEATVADAMRAARIIDIYPEIEILPVGIFSRIVPLITRLKSGDRIEIYRPLLIDPKTKRRTAASFKLAQ